MSSNMSQAPSSISSHPHLLTISIHLHLHLHLHLHPSDLKMRYEDWDVLLFEKNSIIPLQEFRVECHAVHHTEFMAISPGLPTLTCFVPSLKAGAPFRISIHSWNASSVDQPTHNSPVETKLFIDGFLVRSSSSPGTRWPHIIEDLRFPAFQKEFFHRLQWSPADNLGRIKLLVVGSLGAVVFSFQHAPQDILENHQIAWPNRSMWAYPANYHRFDINTQRYQSICGFRRQDDSERNEDAHLGTLSFSESDNSTPGYPNTPVNAAISPWSLFALQPSVDDSPCSSVRKPQTGKKNHSPYQAFPPFPMFTNATFGVDHEPQRRASQQMYTQSNSSVPMSLVQPQLQSHAVYGSTELGRRTPAGSSVRLVLAPNHNSPGESFNSDVVERATKRARLNTPESVETVKSDGPPIQRL